MTLATAAAVCAFPAFALAAPNETNLVSRANGAGGAKQNGTFVDGPAISADGRFVAFVANNASNLPGGAASERVFLRDTQSGATTLVSQGAGDLAVLPNGPSREPAISADGRFVAFESEADNLVASDNNTATDVFLRDTQMNTTILVSRAGFGNIGNDDSTNPSISADGRFVAFETDATDIGVNDNNGVSDIYVRDDGDGQTWSISLNTDNFRGNGASINPSISADGLRVAFESKAINLDPADTDVQDDIFLREREADGQVGTTTLVNRADGANGAKGTSSVLPTISADGRHVAFSSLAPLETPADSNGLSDAYVRNVETAETTLVSREDGASGAVGDGISIRTAISADGRFVAFESRATNLDADDAALIDIYLRDNQTNQTILLDRANGVAGEAANDNSIRPSISGDGLITGFYTPADNLDGDDMGGDDDDTFDDVYTREADVDIVAPAALINSPPPARTADSTPTVGYSSAAVDLAGFECSIDGATFAACAGSSITTPQLADGTHNVRVRAFDTSANRGAPVTANFTVDTAGPATQIDSAPPATVTSNTATVGFSSPAADAVAFQCSVDGAAFAPCASPFTTPALSDGAHTVDVRAVDDVGNVGGAQRASFDVAIPSSDPNPPPVDEPDNEFSFGKTKLNAKKGTATLAVNVPGAGELELEGKDVKPASADASRASTVNLPVKAKGDLKKKLKDKGKAKAKVEVTFTPTGGDPNSQTKSVKLELD